MKRFARISMTLCSGLIAGMLGVAAQSQDAQKPAPGPAPAPPPLTVSSRPNAVGGERLYLEKCAMCHGPNGMGTGLLGRGNPEPLLELRKDLTADYVVQAARMGIGNMPAIPRGEVSDAELKQIGEFLTKPRKANQ